ncbi:lactate dehydrogenase-like 2-hydroxyacid dehydrogenase [Altererythrobacter atlanticus]|uniref:Glycerate dehydrogenase n=1 Tax=Croceibacterium atlanticum TaxID=1267766 RepID=A0A0F7KNV1_9SPHN|nr:D-glycerate dehydrogenase [Croceibacterium atlanticum]AKH42188.1 Glycerate dehydrogenase [Croceibacterium atlanticum]MBB5734000.1 lactate dehydrogenase-like 2-hydroxyacid dehydrogenase [Croceibacterium atlanticum]
MERLRVLVTRRWPEEVERALADRFDVTLNETDEPLSQQRLAAAMDEFDILCPTVFDRIDADVIGGGDRVRLIANYGVGFDHIDLEAARAKNIAVTNTPGVLTDATADIAMTLLLMAARRAGEGERELRSGRWDGWRPTHLIGSALRGKVLGLVGFGRIGIATAMRAKHGFGMKIAYYARREADADIAAGLDAEFHPELSSLLAASDFVSLHVPGGEDTAGLIDAEAISAMKASAYLINTARGGVIDHEALADALSTGRIAGAGLDVYPQEPQIPAALLGLENVVLLPHLGSANSETRIAMGMKALANAEAFARGEALPDLIA